MLYESDGKDGFKFSVLLNGYKVKSFTPDEPFNMGLSQYVDHEQTQLAELRLNARLRKEAMEISGMTAEDLKDLNKAETFKRYEDMVRRDYFAQRTNKKAPEAPMDDFKQDLRKEGAFHAGAPLDESAWTLQEKMAIHNYAEGRLKQAETDALKGFDNFRNMRPPSFYGKVYEGHSGLDYSTTIN